MTNQAADHLRASVARHVLAVLPLALFFPQPFANLGILLFIAALLAGGGLRGKWVTIRQHPMFAPVMGLLAICIGAGLLLDRPDGDFWSGFAHYQNYLFLLMFISVGPGAWQQRAIRFFHAGATIAATLFYLNSAGLLPKTWLFASYVKYSGNKSILLGILLAVAAGWMLYDLATKPRRHWLGYAQLVYVAGAAVMLARTRSGLLIFFLLCLYVLFNAVRFSWRRAAAVVGAAVLALLVLQTLPAVSKRIAGTIEDVRNFTAGKRVSGDGERLEIFRATIEVIREKPLTGHGIGTWVHNYPTKITGTNAPMHSTPHNDYLLYLSEIGLIGLAGLLWIWAVQFVVAARLGGEMGAKLAMLGIALLVGGMFNAILRDAVFGLAFMILLAIPLAGAGSRSPALPSRTE